MRRSTIFLSTAAVLVLSAGMVVGRLSSRFSGMRPPDHDHNWFTDQLNLTPDQHEKMDAIWADTKTQMDKINDHRHGMDHDRDAAIRKLLTPEQLTAYDGIFDAYHAKRAEFDKDREKLLHDADDRSRALLSPEQQVKFDAMKKDMHNPDHRDHGPGGPPGRSRMDSATQPNGAGNS